jgi:tetratricopeptide (TPR) repeat protein
MKYYVLIVAALLFLTFPVLADEEHHHEDLTSEQLGTVHFPISCSPSTQKTFERGVALLHSFWYEEAEKAFQQVAKDDPQCAMAHWGVAMSLWHQLWDDPNEATLKRGAAELKKAKSLHSKEDRERGYIAALDAFYEHRHRKHLIRATAYSQRMEQLYQKYPDDHEAGIFYALSLIASEPDKDPNYANRRKAAAVLEKIFAEEPNHPGVAHYLIHSYDKPEMAELGLPAARRYAKIAPVAPHAVHMPSHIFARLGLWQEDIDSNLASIAATHKSEEMHMGGAGHQFHAMDFLVYAYLQSGHEADVLHVIDEVKAMPAMKDMYKGDSDPRFVMLELFEASYALELHHWADAAALPLISGTNGDDSVTYRARAIGAARSGNLSDAHKALTELEKIHADAVRRKLTYAGAMDDERKEAEAWIDHAEGKNDAATKLLRDIADTEGGVFQAGDGIPAREMLADMLLEMGRSEQALTEYETDLKQNPNRFDSLYGAARAAEKNGKSDKANIYYAQLVKICDGSNSGRPELSQARAQLAKKGAETASASQD